MQLCVCVYICVCIYIYIYIYITFIFFPCKTKKYVCLKNFQMTSFSIKWVHGDHVCQASKMMMMIIIIRMLYLCYLHTDKLYLTYSAERKIFIEKLLKLQCVPHIKILYDFRTLIYCIVQVVWITTFVHVRLWVRDNINHPWWFGCKITNWMVKNGL